MKGTSEHGTRFFAEARTSASSSLSARFFTQDSTCMIANAEDERCLQCSPTKSLAGNVFTDTDRC